MYAKGDSSEAAEGKKEEEKGEEDVAKMARLAGLDLRHIEKCALSSVLFLGGRMLIRGRDL